MNPALAAPTVSAAWLVAHLDDPAVRVVDCRFALSDPDLGPRQYGHSHIPGAVYLGLNQDLSSPVQAEGGRHPLPDPVTLAATLGRCGIASGDPAANSPPTLVVAYDDSRFAFAARLWWLLHYLGHSQVAVLDGGWGQWQAQGHPVTAEMPAPAPAVFVPRPQPELVVSRAQVQQRPPHTCLIDSRSPERYRGEVEPIDPVAGSVPGAVNYFWQGVSTEEGYLQSQDWLQDHWRDLPSAEDVVVYCGSGVTACVNALAQVAAGRTMPRLYVGGWSDWCRA